MYEGCMKDRCTMYEADNRQFKEKRTREDAFFLPSYINCTSYIVPSYIFLALFSSYSRAKNILFVKKTIQFVNFFARALRI